MNRNGRTKDKNCKCGEIFYDLLKKASTFGKRSRNKFQRYVWVLSENTAYAETIFFSYDFS